MPNPSQFAQTSLSGTAGLLGEGRIETGLGEMIVAENPEGSGPFVFVCDHASNRIPDPYKSFGFDEDALQTHIAWDPGALGVARRLSVRFDGPLFWPAASRLIIDCNRSPEAKSLIVSESEGRKVAANFALTEAERSRRLGQIHAPYHAAIDACLERRRARRQPTALIALHSYTPVYLGKPRPWQVGIVFGADRRLADLFIRELEADPTLSVGINEPYSPEDQVYYTVERHAGPGALPAVMIEIRNDEIGDDAGERRWADRLAAILTLAQRSLVGDNRAAV
ncbi:MAG: N-formylglutamate amidohydrolase [Methyloceanibacter sp.]